MDRAPRRSRRLAKQSRRARRSQERMSVGDAYGVHAHDEVDATNLSEARAMRITRNKGCVTHGFSYTHFFPGVTRRVQLKASVTQAFFPGVTQKRVLH